MPLAIALPTLSAVGFQCSFAGAAGIARTRVAAGVSMMKNPPHAKVVALSNGPNDADRLSLLRHLASSGPTALRFRVHARREEFLHTPAGCRTAHRFETIIEFAGEIECRLAADSVVILFKPVAGGGAAEVAQIGQERPFGIDLR